MKNILVYGGTGGLGSVCVQHLKKLNYWVCSVGFEKNPEADQNIVISQTDNSMEQHSAVSSVLSNALNGQRLSAVLCVAGGWAGGNQSVFSSSIASSIACTFLEERGLLVLSGSESALDATPGMIGYGMAKAAVHHLTKSLAATDSGFPPNATAVSILPVILDTPMNRKWMSKADKSSWTSLETVATLFTEWIDGKNRPRSGSLIKLITINQKTECIPV